MCRQIASLFWQGAVTHGGGCGCTSPAEPRHPQRRQRRRRQGRRSLLNKSDVCYLIWNTFIEVTVGLLSLTVASGGMSPLPAQRVQQDNMEAAVGGVVSMVMQGLGECRLLLVTSTPVTDMLSHVLRLTRDGGAACWTLVFFLAEVPDTDDILNNKREGSNNTSGTDGHNEGGRKDINASFKNSNQDIKRFLEKSGLWMLPETRVLVVGWDTSGTLLLQHPSLRNIRHLFLLLLLPADKGRTVELYRRCLFCSTRERGTELLLREKATLQLHVKQRLLLGRLVNLWGSLLTVITMDYFPHVDYHRSPNHQPGGKVLPKDCLDFRMVDAIASHLNFSYVVREPPDGQWGVRDDSGHFTGIVGSLEREEGDLSMVLTPTPDRLEVMDHSRIYGEGAFVIISLKPRPATQHWAFVKSFRDELWLTLLSMVVVWGVLLWAMLKAWTWIRVDREVRWSSLTSAILYGFGALLEDPPHPPPTNLSAQVMVGWWWVLCIIITTAYRSSLISHLTVPGISRPVNTFDDLLELEGWSWSAEIGLLNMADRDFFLGSPSPVVREVYRLMEFYTLEDALQKVLKGRHSFITWKNYIDVRIASRYSDARGITPLYVSNKRYPIFGGYSWGFRRGAPFLDAIKRLKQCLLESGILTYWLSDVIKQRVRETRKNSQEGQDASVTQALLPNLGSGEVVLGLSHLQGVFYFLFAGFVVSLITLMCEQAFTHTNTTREVAAITKG
ncbi:hypothetical protein O3P69_004262 [Scylla paramamosain]|uniref:Ionotropic glutamate receptor L-glutamate and glycine-binding domain-containing protein n=1 Tax=Scylla paramamosain TaxID=85552 RepID=A0AAW0UJQ5_SCYPA